MENRVRSTSRTTRGFTLIELLVVISVIALLMAILVPALASARSSAKSLVCRSNVRQLVLANTSYAGENDGYYVRAASDMWDNAGLHRWHGARDSLDEPFDPNRSPLSGYLADGQINECPEKIGFARGEDWNTNFEQGCGGYGYNMAYLGSRFWQGGIGGPQAFKDAYAATAAVTELGTPSETLMFADTAMSNEQGTYIEYSFAEPPFAVYAGKVMTGFYMSPSIHFRHRSQASVGWADGHVGISRMACLKEENAYGVDSSQANLGWFEPVDNSLFDLK